MSSKTSKNSGFEIGQRVKLVNAEQSRPDLAARLGQTAVVTAVEAGGSSSYDKEPMISVRFDDGTVFESWYAYRFEAVVDLAVAVMEADVRAAFRDGGTDVRAALKTLFPKITFTVPKTVPKTRKLKDIPVGQWFLSWGGRYQRIAGYTGSGAVLVDDATRIYVVGTDGVVDFYFPTSADITMTLTDAAGVVLTETIDEVC